MILLRQGSGVSMVQGWWGADWQTVHSWTLGWPVPRFSMAWKLQKVFTSRGRTAP
jgi:hypothetical protein